MGMDDHPIPVVNKCRSPLPGNHCAGLIFKQVILNGFRPPLPNLYMELSRHNVFYGFPALENKLKIAIHHGGIESNPDTVDREVHRKRSIILRVSFPPILT